MQYNPTQQERLSELVTQLSGAPLDRSRAELRAASTRNLGADSLWNVAEALIALRTG